MSHDRKTPRDRGHHQPEPELAALRQRAEARLGVQDAAQHQTLTPQETARLVHELRVHQIELEMQNEELRVAQEALEVSRTRYFDLYDLAPVGYLTLGEHGMIRDANLAAAQLLGMPRSLVLNVPLSRFIGQNDADRLYHCRQNLIVTGVHQNCEVTLQRADETNLTVRLDMTLGVDRETGSAQFLTMLSDITEQRAADTLRDEKALRKEQFIAAFGHALRNPLAPIRQIAELLTSKDPLDPQQLQQAGGILGRQSIYLTRLADDLLDVARIGRGGIPLAKRHCDLREVARTAVEQLRLVLEQAGQHLEMRLPERPANVHGDPVRLAQAIANLLRNASQSSAPGTQVTLDMSPEDNGRYVVVRVMDEGIGFEAAELTALFAPSSRGEPMTMSASGGLGMGLALAKAVVDLHGGQLDANSPGPGQGSTFSLRLRVWDQASPDLSPVARGGPLARHCVLVVDDQPDVAQACALLLETLGQEVVVVGDGHAAIEAVERESPDLILIDLGMPGMDGYEVARRLRTTAAGQRARLVAVTGHHQDRDRSHKAGFDGHLFKPVGQAALIEALGRCRGSPRRTPPVADGS